MQEWVAITALVVSVIGLLMATYSDIKQRMVDDKVSYGLAGIGILLFLINAVLNGEWLLFGWSVAAGIGTFLVGYGLWRVGFWAGGDVKLFTGLATLNPINWVMIARIGKFPPLAAAISLPLFPLSLFLVSVLALLPVGLLLVAGKAVKQPKKFETVFSNLKKRLVSIVFSSLFVSVLSFWLAGNESIFIRLGIPSAVFLVLVLLLMGWVEKKIKTVQKMVGFLSVLLLGTGFWFWGMRFVWDAILLLLLLALVAFFVALFFSNKLFRSQKPVEKLEEGDIPAVSMVETGGRIEARPELGFWEIIKNLKNQGLVQSRPSNEREICSSRRAGGLEKEQIEEIRALAEKNRIPKILEVKESAAFVPAVLVAYLLLNTMGDPLRWLL